MTTPLSCVARFYRIGLLAVSGFSIVILATTCYRNELGAQHMPHHNAGAAFLVASTFWAALVIFPLAEACTLRICRGGNRTYGSTRK